MQGVATADDIDKGMKLGTNSPMGPLSLADFIGAFSLHLSISIEHHTAWIVPCATYSFVTAAVNLTESSWCCFRAGYLPGNHAGFE